MNIAILSDNEDQGGAGIAATRLALALSSSGHSVTRLVYHLSSHSYNKYETVALCCQSSVPLRITRKLLPSALRAVVGFQVVRRLDACLERLQPDIINVHNLHGARWADANVGLVGKCYTHAPVVWTLHDMWSFTGRCVNSRGCERFVDGCDSRCPTPTEYPPLRPLKIQAAWEKRREYLGGSPFRDLTAVAPSQWLAREARRGLWRNHDVEVIPNGLDLNVYRPQEKRASRARLGLPLESRILLTGGSAVPAYKGLAIVAEALSHLQKRGVVVVTLGGKGLTGCHAGVALKHLGHIHDDAEKATAYSAADVYVHPSYADNLPNMVMESIACGTPVAAFRINGVPELVRPGQTGVLADNVSPRELADKIDELLDATRSSDLNRQCRAIAEAEYGDALMAKRYSTLFARIQWARPREHKQAFAQ